MFVENFGHFLNCLNVTLCCTGVAMKKPCRFRPISHVRPRINVSAFALLAFALATLACACALPTTRLAAQDVTVMPPVLFDLPDNPNQPDTPPTLAKQWLPAYPKRLLGSVRPSDATDAANPGYVIFTLFIDEKAQPTFRYNGSSSWHTLSVTMSISTTAALQILPAKKNGEPVASASWMAVLFNPASASETAQTATPRLLKAAPVMITEEQAQAFPKESRSLRATIEIDADGTPKNPRFETSEPFAQALLPAVEKSLAQWQFAPAREAGQPVPGKVSFDLLFQTAHDFDKLVNKSMSPASSASETPKVMPKVIRQTKPEYPSAMRGISGSVTLQFIVDPNGNVKDLTLISSSNRGFEQASINAVLKWKFKPALDKNGKPMKALMRITLEFARR